MDEKNSLRAGLELRTARSVGHVPIFKIFTVIVSNNTHNTYIFMTLANLANVKSYLDIFSFCSSTVTHEKKSQVMRENF